LTLRLSDLVEGLLIRNVHTGIRAQITSIDPDQGTVAIHLRTGYNAGENVPVRPELLIEHWVEDISVA
jgi:hypothetical protein